MRAAFRADASREIGTGHVMRCLTLADELKARGWDTLFLCKPFEGNLVDRIREQGHRVQVLPSDSSADPVDPDGPAHAAWLRGSWRADADACLGCLRDAPADGLVVDHYALDARWESALRGGARRILAVDDMADRPHDADLLLDQNLRPDQGRGYDALLPAACRRLLGPAFALLRPEFSSARAALADRSGEARNILVFLGGSDPDDHTGKCLAALDSLGRPDLAWTVVIGPANPHGNALERRFGSRPGTVFRRDVRAMAPLLAAADLALAGGGVSTWERICLGLPAVALSIALNQEGLLAAAAAEGLLDYAGRAAELSTEDIASRVRALLADSAGRRAMAAKALAAVDGMGRVRAADALDSACRGP